MFSGKQDGKGVSQDHQEHTVLEPCYDTFASAKRPLLIGMYCMISTGREGFLYEVYDGIKPIASYPYTAQSYQVRVLTNQHSYSYTDLLISNLIGPDPV